MLILSGAKVQIHNNENGILSLKISSNNINIVKTRRHLLGGKFRLMSDCPPVKLFPGFYF